MKLLKSVLTILLVMSFTSCEKDNNIPLNEPGQSDNILNPFLDNFGATTTARFIGTVVNEENNPISGVTVSIGNTVAITDANGVFSITEASVFEKFAYVKASKSGFMDGSRSLVPTDGVNQVQIMLLDAEPIGTIASGQAITFDLPNGSTVDFSGDFQSVLGVYQGNVDVVFKHLSPDDENMSLQMPGSLIGENTDGDLRVLETYGMIAVELIGENGEDLDIATTAQIKIPVPASVTNPPATIPLWSFDEVNGYWVEEGFATLDGSFYVGDVEHFSFWNWDFQYPAVTVCITLQDENGTILPNTPLNLFSPALNATGTYGFTNADGIECGLVPQDDTLTLVVPNYGCIGNDFTTTIGPFATDENITITVTGSNALNTNFIATLNDCTGNPITDGYANLFYNNQSHIITITNGLLSENIPYCDTDTAYSIQVFDIGNSQSTDAQTGNFTTPTTDLGMQMSCVDLTDADADGVLDIDEDLNNNNNLDDDDTDQDGIADYLDQDDDGDGVNTIDEDYDNDGNPMNEDSDADGIPDYLDPQDVLVFVSEIIALNCDINNLEYNLTEDLNGTIFSFPNTTFSYFETQTDADTNTNAIVNPSSYININMLQQVYVLTTNTISNQSAVGQLLLLGSNFQDSDNDGLSDCEELTGIDTANNNCNPNGNITDPNNADSDGDGFDDCVESQQGTDPNDVSDFPNEPTFNCCNNDSLSGMDVNTIVNSQEDVQFFDAITPNGDGLNDRFVIVNINLYPSNTFSVYDDQDNLVYQITGYNNTNVFFQGDSSTTGQALVDGTYRYELNFADALGQTNIRNGFICIVTDIFQNASFISCSVNDVNDPFLSQ